MKLLIKRAVGLFFVVLPHINLSMSVVMLTLLVTDYFNRAMAFINNNITKGMLFVWCFLIILQSLNAVWRHRKGKRSTKDGD